MEWIDSILGRRAGETLQFGEDRWKITRSINHLLLNLIN